MIQIQSIEQLRQLVAEARKQRFITNFFFDPDKHSVWITRGDCYTEQVGETLFIIRCDKFFWNVFYSSTSLEKLTMDLRLLFAEYSNQTMMFDVVGKEIQCLTIVEMMKEHGCKVATSLVRMTRVGEPFDYCPDSTVRAATSEEVPLVRDLLHQYFDAQLEQLPYEEELLDFARQGHMLVCEENGVIAGFLLYELNATTLYPRYWFTNPAFRDKRIGSRLFRKVFEEGRSTKRQILWVIRTNENAIKRYRHYGFKEENMYDFVLQYN